MALSEKLRSSIFRSLSPVIGEEETAAVLSHFPANDMQEPATKDHVLLETAVIRSEMADLRTELQTGLAELRTDLNTGLAEVRAELNTGLADVRAEVNLVRADLSTEIAKVRAEQAASTAQIHQTLNRMFVALVTVQLTIAGGALAIVKL